MAQFDTAGLTGARSGTDSAVVDAGLRAHMSKVYGTMSVGLLITALAAWAIAALAVSSEPSEYMLRSGEYLTGLGYSIFATPLKYVIMFAPLAMVFGFSMGLNRMSAAGAQLYFYVFSAVMGLSLSAIFLIYTGVSITQTFLVTAIGFASLSLWGYTTKRDISAWGAFLIMGVIGLFVASLINLYMQSGTMSFAISALGVLIFAGLTAFDTQKIKNTYLQHAGGMDGEWMGKAAISGALELYLDFINMFIFLLRFIGDRR